ncbi:hypothetical protein, partial [Streptomyces zingiberis]
ITSETVGGRTISSRYDALGRRTTRITPMGAKATRTYDPAGNTATLTTSGHTLTYHHDPAGHELTRHLGDHATLTQTWDPAGRLTTQTLLSRPTGSRGAGPDPTAWRPGTAGTPLPGGAAGTPLPGGAAGTPLPGGAAGTAEVRRHRAYTYRPDGHLTAIDDPMAGGLRHFDLDPAGRVTAVHA